MASFPYQFVTDTWQPPNDGEVRANGDPAELADTLYVSATPAGMPALLELEVGDVIRLELAADPTWYDAFTVAYAPADAGTYSMIAVAWQSGGTGHPYGTVDLILPDAVPVDPDAPFVLGPADVFASPAELAGYLGGQVGTGGELRRDLALIAASRWVCYRVGLGVSDDPIPPGPITVVPVAARPAWRAATLVVATRFYRSADAVFGAMGGLGDDAVIVNARIPEAELLLVGQTVSWGLA